MVVPTIEVEAEPNEEVAGEAPVATIPLRTLTVGSCIISDLTVVGVEGNLIGEGYIEDLRSNF